MYSAMSATFGRVHCAPPLVAFPRLPSTSRSNSLIRICQSSKGATRSASMSKAELDDDRLYAILPPEEEAYNLRRRAILMAKYFAAKQVPRAEEYDREAKQIELFETSEGNYRLAVGSGNWFLAVTSSSLGRFCLLTEALIRAILNGDKVDYTGRDKDYLEMLQRNLESIVPEENFRLYQEISKDDDVVWEPDTFIQIEKEGVGNKKLVCYDEDCKFFCTTCRRSMIVVRSQIESSLSIPTE